MNRPGALLVLALFALSGCWQSRSDTERVEVERVRGTQAGQPVDLVTTRQSEETAKTQAGADPAALAAAVVAGLKGTIPGAEAIAGALRTVLPPPTDLSPLARELAALNNKPAPVVNLDPLLAEIKASRPAPAPGGIDGTTGTALGGAAGLAALALREYLAHRSTAKDNAEGWAEAKEAQRRAEQYALKLPPET